MVIKRDNQNNPTMDRTELTALWAPSAKLKASCQMRKFLEHVFTLQKIKQVCWADLYEWSINDVGDFWSTLSEFVGLKWITAPTYTYRPGETMRAGVWFEDARLNFAENLLPKPSSQVVLVAIAEGAARREWTALQLWNDVARCAKALKDADVRPGDRVAGVLINGPEAIIAMLGAAVIGAVWSSCSPDFGAAGIRDRLSQIRPKIVFATAWYQYAGKKIVNLDQTKEALKDLQHPPKIIVVDHFNRGNDEFANFCGRVACEESIPEAIDFLPRGFSDPQYILFSSGTTGLPKCIVHGVGGTLLQHKKELMLHSDLRENDRLLFFTTCGWMMWNWMVSALSVGASVVTFDGAPTVPGLSRLWDICREEGVTHFGTSPKFISSCSHDHAFNPNLTGPLNSLRVILSTGSPLLPAHYEWIYKNFSRVHLASISGGTDIIGCFMLGNPILPVYSGEIQSPGLGMAIQSWNDLEQPVLGEKGELVCVKPFISMPVGFWDDPGGARYHKAYFDHYAGRDVWRHGDFIEMTPRGGVIVYGRSDATLNPGGVRIGTSEIYRAVENLPMIADSLAVGLTVGEDVRVILFLKLQSEVKWSDDLDALVKGSIRSQLTPRHVPYKIIPVTDIPYTRSGKKVELAVARILRGEDVSDTVSLANPEVLSEYKTIKKTLIS
jgi:acetoacetyl-CoA synthetase